MLLHFENFEPILTQYSDQMYGKGTVRATLWNTLNHKEGSFMQFIQARNISHSDCIQKPSFNNLCNSAENLKTLQVKPKLNDCIYVIGIEFEDISSWSEPSKYLNCLPESVHLKHDPFLNLNKL